MNSEGISVTQLVDVTGQGVFQFRVEVATPSSDFKDIPFSHEYMLFGVDGDGRKLYASAWLDLESVLKEVERISTELKSRGKTVLVSSRVRSRVVDTL
ncbi:MAG: hypothetical protein WED05_00610 [Candidatus Atabeyarchaeum deiterrae]